MRSMAAGLQEEKNNTNENTVKHLLHAENQERCGREDVLNYKKKKIDNHDIVISRYRDTMIENHELGV